MQISNHFTNYAQCSSCGNKYKVLHIESGKGWQVCHHCGFSMERQTLRFFMSDLDDTIFCLTLIVGDPCSGKTTYLSNFNSNCIKLSIGKILRESLGVSAFVDGNVLVEGLVRSLILNHISLAIDLKRPLIIDSAPRSYSQAVWLSDVLVDLNRKLELKAEVVHLVVDKSTLQSRVEQRTGDRKFLSQKCSLVNTHIAVLPKFVKYSRISTG